MSEFVSLKHVKIRKDHQCRVCGEIIVVGDQCMSYRGVERGVGFYTIHAHVQCWKYTDDWDEADWETFLPGCISRDEIKEAMGEE